MDTDITVIGAGVVGLAIAAELSGRKRQVTILEKEGAHGRGISSRNSEVIHAGIYYPPGSLKARLCVEGRRRLYELCAKHAIPHARLGKLIVAVSESETAALEGLAKNAAQNGVKLDLLDEHQVRALEPNIRAAAALLSPDTGIVSAHALMDHYLARTKASGGDIVYRTAVVGIERISGGYRVDTLSGSGERYSIETGAVVNAAGLHSDEIARMIGAEYRLHYCKGDYFGIRNVEKGTVTRLVYPVPEKDHAGLGVHLTIDLAGRMRLGPDAAYIERIENYRVDHARRDAFYEAAARFLPFLRRENIVPEMAGIRPKLQGPGEGFRDFVIRQDAPGFVNLVGIESPGLTASPAIAEHVVEMLGAG